MDERQIGAERLRGIDLLRGLVMVLMVIDHVRVFSGISAGGTTPDLFFTRWITHFCAPVFVFLAGTSAWLYSRRHADLSRYLLTRGLLLIVLEFSVIRLAWTFNLDYAHYALAGVIWVIGISMIALALITRLPMRAVLVFGLVVVGAHNLFDAFLGARIGELLDSPWAPLWKLLYLGPAGGPIGIGSLQLHVLYSFVPWVGVMALGFAFAPLLMLPATQRDRWCRSLGFAAIALFIVLRAAQAYGDPRGYGDLGHLPPWLAFVATTKYPASLQFLLMTLGPALALLPWFERRRGPISDALIVIGREPLLFYLLHIPLVHALAIAVSWLRAGQVDPWLFANHPMGAPPPPDAYVWPLWLLYLVFAIATPLLYLACKDYARRRRTVRMQ